MSRTLYVGLDVQKDTIAAAIAAEGRSGENRWTCHGIVPFPVLFYAAFRSKAKHCPSGS